MRVGSKVFLNDNGMRQIGGLTSKAMMEAAQDLTITSIDKLSVTTSHLIYAITVDHQLIDCFMLTTDDVSLQSGGK